MDIRLLPEWGSGRNPPGRNPGSAYAGAHVRIEASGTTVYHARGCSSVGRAPVLQAGGRRVEADHLHQSSDPEREGQRTRLLIAEVTVRARVGPPDTGKDGRAVEGTCLEGRIPSKSEPGFEPGLSATTHCRVGLTGEDATLSRWNDGLDTRTRRQFRDRCWGVAQWVKARDSDSRDDGSIPSTPASVWERGVMTARPAFNRQGPGLSPGAPTSGSTISP